MAETKEAVKEEVKKEVKKEVVVAVKTVFDGLHSKDDPKPGNGKFSTKASRGTLDKR